LAAADALEFPFLQHSQESELSFARQVADLVQKNRTTVGQLEAAEAPLQCAGESAFLVSEQFRSDERLRDRRAIDANECPRRTIRPLVNRARDQLLAFRNSVVPSDRQDQAKVGI
jgi:hypothetical protein